jgi:hypothetical protein
MLEAGAKVGREGGRQLRIDRLSQSRRGGWAKTEAREGEVEEGDGSSLRPECSR